MQRDGEGGSDDEHVVTGGPACLQRRQGDGGVVVGGQLDNVTAQGRQQRPRGVEGDDPAGVHDGDPIAQPFGFVQVMGGQQDRRLARRPKPGDQVEELVADARIEPDSRLGEEEHLRPGDQGASNLQPAALPAVVAGHRAVHVFGNPEGLRDLDDPALGSQRVDAPQPGMDFQVAPSGEGTVNHGLLEDDRARLVGGDRLGSDVESGDPSGAAGRDDRRRQHANRGGFPRTVRAQQPEHPPPARRQSQLLSPPRPRPSMSFATEGPRLPAGTGDRTCWRLRSSRCFHWSRRHVEVWTPLSQKDEAAPRNVTTQRWRVRHTRALLPLP